MGTLSNDEQAALMQKLGWGAPGGVGPAPGPASPPISAPVMNGPLENALAASNNRPGAAPFAPPPPAAPIAPFRLDDSRAHLLPPGAPAGPRTMGADQTVGYTPGAGGLGGGSLPPPPMAPQGTSSSHMSTTVQSGIPLSAETLAASKASDEHGRKAADLEANALQAQNKQKAAGAEQLAGAYQGFQHDAASQAARQEADLADRRSKLAAMVEDVSNQKIDPDRYFKSKSVLQKIGMVISMGLGGFVAGRTGRPNEAAAMVQHAIDSDIDMQKTDIANKRAGVATAGSLYDMTRGAYHDENERAAATRVLGLEAVKAQIDRQAALSSDPLVQARAEQMKADVEAKILQQHAHLDEMSANRKSTTTGSTYSSGGAAGTTGKDAAAIKDLSKERQQAGIPAAEAKLREADEIIARNGGEVPGSSFFSRNILKHLPLGDSIRGPDARALDNTITEIAAAQAHQAGMKNEHAIDRFKQIIMGNGSAGDIEAGLARAKAEIGAVDQNLQSGFGVQQNDTRAQLEQYYANRRAASPTAAPPYLKRSGGP